MAAIHDHPAANKAHFNAHAHEYDALIFAKERAQRFVFSARTRVHETNRQMTNSTAEGIRKACTFNKNTTLMEYACGTGTFYDQ